MAEFVKCLVWDLDNTLWKGTLLEGDRVALRPDIPIILEELNHRGVLNSIASRNDPDLALSKLRELGVDKYFIFPHINFDPKPDNLRSIARELNLGIDSLAFIDDSPFEREGVAFSFPSMLVLEVERYTEILDMPAFNPPARTAEAKDRLDIYRTEEKRKQAEGEFEGTRLDFLMSCHMQLLLRRAVAADIPRIVELAYRTHQFNATGIHYTADDVAALMASPNARIYLAGLSDRFGSYGTVAAMIITLDRSAIIESLMISCRVSGRGVSAALLILAMKVAGQTSSKTLTVHYRPTARNRQLGIFYTMLGLRQTQSVGKEGVSLWEYDLNEEPIPEMPAWLTLVDPLENLIP